MAIAMTARFRIADFSGSPRSGGDLCLANWNDGCTWKPKISCASILGLVPSLRVSRRGQRMGERDVLGRGLRPAGRS